MAEPLWTFDELVRVAEGKAEGRAKPRIFGFSIDTRSLEAGDVFVALEDQRDGHEFVGAAFARGAVAALVNTAYAKQPDDGPLIRVDDPLRALERIGIAARARLSDTARVIAVTGSAGKTGTKEMLRACLRAAAASPAKVHAPEKSFNNHWGVPLTLARMPAGTEFGVFEIGMNHAGEILPLTKMVRPHIAIVTNVLPVHVGNFPDGEVGVAKAKAEIFEGLEVGGTAILLRDSPHFALLRGRAEAAGAKVLRFSTIDAASDALCAGGGVRWAGDVEAPLTHVSAVVRSSLGARRLSYDLAMPGGHIVSNSLAVLLVLDVLGHLSNETLRPLAEVRPPAGRGARTVFKTSRVLLIDEAYNANPRSMQEALAVLAAVDREQHPRRIAVMGDMLELGEKAETYHKALKPEAEKADLAFACGANMRHLFNALPPEKQGAWAPTSDELIVPLLAALVAGDAVMVKGSLGTRMAPIVEAIKKRFADG